MAHYLAQQVVPEERIGAREALTDPWLASVRDLERERKLFEKVAPPAPGQVFGSEI
jgi:hypothetical protein